MEEDYEQLKNIENRVFNEQSKFTYYICGLLTAAIGFTFNIVLTSTNSYLFLPLIAIGSMFFSLFFGLYYLNNRNDFLVKYHKSIQIKIEHEKQKSDMKAIIQSLMEILDEIQEPLEYIYKIHKMTLLLGPIIMFFWVLINTFIK